MPVPVALIFVAALVGLGLGLGALATTDPERRLRAYRDPRLVARVDAWARELVARGWDAAPAEPGDPPTIRRVRRAAPGCESLTLVLGCVPDKGWCRVEIVADVGVPEGVSVTPAVRVDRDGAYPLPPQIEQPGGHGFVVRPEEALARLPARLVARLAAWPAARAIVVLGRTITVRVDVEGVPAAEVVVADVLARLIAA